MSWHRDTNGDYYLVHGGDGETRGKAVRIDHGWAVYVDGRIVADVPLLRDAKRMLYQRIVFARRPGGQGNG